MTKEAFSEILPSLPQTPGVYQYFDAAGKVIYVGKAKNLKKRISSYFYKEADRYKTKRLVEEIREIRFTVVDSEQDAFLLENSLIKQYTFQFAMNGIRFHATECALKEIATMAFARGSGARGLRSITENILMETMFVVPSIENAHTVYLDSAAVRGDRKPILLKHPDMTAEKFEKLLKEGTTIEDVEGAELVQFEELDDDFSEAA